MYDDQSDDETPQLYNLSRRRVLGGLGAIGLASAGAGLGTSAFFSDTETYEDNVLVAGALDLRVDWEEHYFGPDDVTDGLANPLYYARQFDDLDAADQEPYVPFPTDVNPVLYVHEEDIDQFMDNTTLESYPDADNNRVQDDLVAYAPCEDFAQMDEDLDPTFGRQLRSLNEDTVLNLTDVQDEGVAPDVAPLVNLDDVKPGDFGELTLSMHLCDNPGYIWLQSELVSAAENGHTEPEANDPDEVGGPASTNPAEVELLDKIQTMLWYDEDGDNVYEPGASGNGEADIVLVLDTSGSMGGTKLSEAKVGAKTLVDAVGANVRVAVVEFNNQENLVQELSSDKAAVKASIDSLSAGGGTNLEGGVNGARDILSGTDVSAEVDPSVTGDASTPDIMVVLSDGAPNVDDGGDANDSPIEEANAAKADGIDIYTIAYGVSAGSTTAQILEDMASSPKDVYAYLAADFNEAEAIFGQIGQIVAGEECFFQGTLRDFIALSTPDEASGEFGIPLDGIRATGFDEVTGDDTSGDGMVDSNYGLGAGDAEGRDPFVDATTNAIGLAWWLPVNHSNEIQTDSVTFDLGFYTEQARHNSGTGQA